MIGIYAHHQGNGHVQRALSVAADLDDEVTILTSARIRDDAMRRGGVAAFDRTAVDLQVTQGRSDDDYGPVVYAAVGPSSGSKGTYGLDGAFLRAQLY